MKKNKKVIIIYGAGRQASVAISKIKDKGLNPVAFCDLDKTKIGKTYFNIPILSKKEVVAKYGEEFNLWISPASPLKEDILEEVIKEGFISEDRIINLSKSKLSNEKYRSCNSLKSVAIVVTEGIYSCCALSDDLRNSSPNVNFENTVESTIDRFFEKRIKLIDDLKNGKACVCDGCPEIREDYWPEDNKIKVLALSPSFPCQLACTYCNLPSNAKFVKNNKYFEKNVKKINIINIMEYFEKNKLLELDEPIQISAGEITIHPNKKEILRYLSKFPLQIFSNCVLYDSQVSDLISREGSFLNISLDAGTRETYKKIKGIDAFDKVIKNISRYKEEGGNIEMKYILLPENCNDENINQFIDFCKKTKLDFLNISCDISADHKNMPIDILDSAVKMAKKAEENGIVYRILPYFGVENMNYIEEKLNF